MTKDLSSDKTVKKILQANNSLNKVRLILLLSLIGFFLLILLFSGMMARQFEYEIRTHTITSLENVLQSNHKLLREVWLKRQFSHGELWATDKHIIQSSEALLKIADTMLLHSAPQQNTLRKYFTRRMKAYDFLGAVICRSDGTILFSMRENFIGTKLDFFKYQKHRLKKLFAGEQQFLPPISVNIKALPSTIRDALGDIPLMAIAVQIQPRGQTSVAASCKRIIKPPC